MTTISDTDKEPLIGKTLEELQQVALDNGLPRFAGAQMAQWIYQKRVASIDEMTNLSKNAREKLNKRYAVGLEAPITKAESTDGTVKYLFRGAGGRNVEAVMIPDKERATLCISSQAGCKMGCTFCMTGKQGYHGNLTAAQIINQIMAVPSSEDLTNIVFMGMGEPLDNLEPVLKVIKILTEKWGFAWSPKRITVSSIGKLKELKRLIEETKVHLAISVHTPMTQQRQQLMPAEKAFPIKDVMALLRDYDFAHQRRLSVEYIMWRGVNDDLKHADALARLIQGTSARVNLIRYHAIPGVVMQPATEEAMETFRDHLNDLGVTATIRASRGEDISAACGMLAGKKTNEIVNND
ncbi:MAG: 23S rRNA (adenine(2503)-C(2))-methyltransferase RlmN [Bacteroidales bacterium]|nr:23S rRNA (adenine(2503)-C(2))-methyltransferase RlmN [Bacteroidales bacterium]